MFLVVGKAASQHAAVAAQCLGAIDGLCIIPKGHKINTSLDVIGPPILFRMKAASLLLNKRLS